jgi:hypothetical protein
MTLIEGIRELDRAKITKITIAQGPGQRTVEVFDGETVLKSFYIGETPPIEEQIKELMRVMRFDITKIEKSSSSITDCEWLLVRSLKG